MASWWPSRTALISALLTLLVALTVGVAACGGDDDEGGTDQSATATATPAKEKAEKRERGKASSRPGPVVKAYLTHYRARRNQKACTLVAKDARNRKQRGCIKIGNSARRSLDTGQKFVTGKITGKSSKVLAVALKHDREVIYSLDREKERWLIAEIELGDKLDEDEEPKL